MDRQASWQETAALILAATLAENSIDQLWPADGGQNTESKLLWTTPSHLCGRPILSADQVHLEWGKFDRQEMLEPRRWAV